MVHWLLLLSIVPSSCQIDPRLDLRQLPHGTSLCVQCARLRSHPHHQRHEVVEGGEHVLLRTLHLPLSERGQLEL